MEAPLSQLAAMLDERFDYPARRDKTKDRRITPVRDDLLGPMQPALLATLAATALILLIGCANVAALVLGQVDARSAEFAVRSALGANRQRLAQQLIVEVLIVAAVAGTLGAALAWVGFTVVTDALPLGAWASTAPDWRVFASAMAIAVIAASLVILVPIVSLYRGDLRSVLSAARMGGNRGTGRAAGKRAGRRAGGARRDDRLGCGAARSQCRQHVRGPTWRAGGWRRGRRRGVRRHAQSCEPREDVRRARAGAA